MLCWASSIAARFTAGSSAVIAVSCFEHEPFALPVRVQGLEGALNLCDPLSKRSEQAAPGRGQERLAADSELRDSEFRL